MTHTIWTRKDRRITADAHCLICGGSYGICSGERRAHRPSKCLACGSLQCWTHGLGHDTCGICLVGLLDAFSPQRCRYKGCTQEAVAEVPRKGFACSLHLAKSRTDTRIMKYLDERSQHWEEVTFDLATVPNL